MVQIGLTGNIAAGKSTVAALWREQGVPVVGADDLAREVVAPGTAGLREVVALFGVGVLAADGSLDRAALRVRVFGDAGARARLEAVLHPLIQARRAAWLEEQRASGASLVVAEIPLLFEVGIEAEFDYTVLVDAPPELRAQRLIRDRGIAPGEAERMMAAQMDPAEKRRRADFVLDNAGDLAMLRSTGLELLGRLRALPPRRGGPPASRGQDP